MASAQVTYDAYIFGPGDGTLHLPRLRAFYNVDLAGQDLV